LETLSEVGYATPPLYEVVSFWDHGVPYARTTATVLPHPEHPEWADLSMMFFVHRGVESVESAARRILHTFCEQHPDEVILTTLGLFQAMDPLDPTWHERISLTDVLLMTDPPEVVVCQLLRLLEAVYNLQVFRLSTQGMLSLVLVDSTAMRDILTSTFSSSDRPLLTSNRRLLHFRTSVSSGTRSAPSSQSSCSPETTLSR
jgi:hypothetical protein